MKYEVHTALSEDANEARVWVKDIKKRQKLEGYRRIVRIRKEGGKDVYCEALYADHIYVERFNHNRSSPIDAKKDHLIFINGWHRQVLGIKLQDEDLEIDVGEFPTSLLWQFKVILHHPQIVVRLTTVLAIIGTGLGLIGLGLGFVSIKDLDIIRGQELSSIFLILGLSVAILGILLAIVGVIPLFKRAT